MYTNLLQFICSLLKLHQIPYMVTGSVAVNIYVLPRSTADIDIVIEVPPDKIEEFVHLFDANFYINHEIARAELQHKGVGMFNIIDYSSNYKVDFIIRKNTKYEIEKFNNRRTVVFSGIEVTVCSPEDLLISKLQWIQVLQSDRQMNDIRNLLQLPNLNLEYIKIWITKLNLNTFNLLKS